MLKLPAYIIETGYKRKLKGPYLTIRNTTAFLTGLYLIIASIIYPEPLLHRGISLGLVYFIIFLTYGIYGEKTEERVPIYDLVLAVLSLSVIAYIALNYQRLIHRLIFFDPVYPLDIAFGITAIILVLEGTRRIIGPWLPTLAILSIAYFAFGQYIPGKFGHQGFEFSYMIDSIFLSSHGLWGSTMGTATGHVIMFLIFGAFFLKSGAGDFLYDFASKLAGSSTGGIAKIAVISSALFGMISGGPLSNVSTTGSMTIPAMIKKGYTPEFAASTESCSSIGGTFMPPVMGSVVFLMSEVVGTPYGTIAKQALIPAFLYFSTIFYVIDSKSRLLGITGNAEQESKKWKELFKVGYGFFIPITFLILRISNGSSPSKAALETIMLIIALSFANEEARFNFTRIRESLIAGIDKGLLIISTMATCAIMIGIVNTTGLTSKFTSYMLQIADISVILSLIVVMGLALFLGLAMNTISTYVITAVICAPVLISLGFNNLAVHMFILYFSATSSITPPVALTSFVAASIAGASPMKVGWMSMRMGIAAYILPFVFLYNPELLLFGNAVEVSITAIGAFLGVKLIAEAIEGWFILRKATMSERGMLFVIAVLSFYGSIITVVSAYLLWSGLYFYSKATMQKSYQI